MPDGGNQIEVNPVLVAIANAINVITTGVNNQTKSTQGAITSQITTRVNDLQFQVTGVNNNVTNSVNQSTNTITNAVNNSYRGIVDWITANTANLNRSQAEIKNQISTSTQAQTAAINANSAALSAGIQNHTSSLVTNFSNNVQTSIQNTQNALHTDILGISQAVANIKTQIESAISDTVSGIVVVLQNLFTPFIDFLAGLIKLFQQWFENNVTDKLGAFFQQTDKLRDAHYDIFKGKFPNNPDVLVDLGIVSDDGAITSKLLLTIMSIPTLIGLLGKVTEPAWRNFVYKQEAAFTSQLLPLPTLIQLYLRGNIDATTFQKTAAKYGINADDSTFLILASRELLNVNDIRDAFYRGAISEEDVNTRIQRLGFTPTDTSVIKSLFPALPPIQDVIRMAVREVFSPDVRQRFGLDQDFPKEVITYANQQGLSKDWAERYWAAHWDLPSATQGFEMYHRGIIDLNDLKLLLRALDISPFWREKLIQISYNPVTRVDVRRLYKMGIWNRDQVYRSYLDIGYKPEDAEALTQFTIRYEADSESDDSTKLKTLTRSVFERAYRRGRLDRNETLDAIVNLGYVRDDADLLLDIVDYDKAEDLNPDRTKSQQDRLISTSIDAYRKGLASKSDTLEILTDLGFTNKEAEIEISFADMEYQTRLKSFIVDSLRDMYLQRIIDETTLIGLLGQYRFTGDETSKILNELNLMREFRTKKPSEAQFRALLKDGIIDVETYKEELRGMGYNENYLDYMVALA